MSAKYVAACIRLLSDFVNEGKNTLEMTKELANIRGNLRKRFHPKVANGDSTSPMFVASESEDIEGPPNKREANVDKVYDILKSCRGI